MGFLIGLLIGLFVYGSIMYYLYWSNTINKYTYSNSKIEIFIYILIGLGWVWFIPHALVSLVIIAIRKLHKGKK